MLLKINNVFDTILESSSLPAFLIYIQFIDQGITTKWLGPYLLSTLLGGLATIYLIQKKRVLNRVFIGIHGYFASGLVSVFFGLTPINQLYGVLGASAMLVWIGVICLTITLMHGNLMGKTPDTRLLAVPKSYVFVLICALCAYFSWLTMPNRVLSEIMPFATIFVLYGLWFKKGANHASAKQSL